LNERLNSRGAASAEWQLTRFQLTEVTAIPEADVSLWFALLSLVLVRRKSRCTRYPFGTAATRL